MLAGLRPSYSQNMSFYNYIESCFHFVPIKTTGVGLGREKEDTTVAVERN